MRHESQDRRTNEIVGLQGRMQGLAGRFRNVISHVSIGRRVACNSRGQSIVEFALTLPIILIIMVMICEFGWFVAQSSASISAAREAGRYASSVGAAGGTLRYLYCDGIRAAARNATSMVTTLTADRIEIRYVDNAGNETTAACNNLESGSTGPIDSEIERFEQAEITVEVPYTAMTPLGALFLGSRDIVTIDRRTIAKRP